MTKNEISLLGIEDEVFKSISDISGGIVLVCNEDDYSAHAILRRMIDFKVAASEGHELTKDKNLGSRAESVILGQVTDFSLVEAAIQLSDSGTTVFVTTTDGYIENANDTQIKTTDGSYGVVKGIERVISLSDEDDRLRLEAAFNFISSLTAIIAVKEIENSDRHKALLTEVVILKPDTKRTLLKALLGRGLNKTLPYFRALINDANNQEYQYSFKKRLLSLIRSGWLDKTACKSLEFDFGSLDVYELYKQAEEEKLVLTESAVKLSSMLRYACRNKKNSEIVAEIWNKYVADAMFGKGSLIYPLRDFYVDKVFRKPSDMLKRIDINNFSMSHSFIFSDSDTGSLYATTASLLDDHCPFNDASLAEWLVLPKNSDIRKDLLSSFKKEN